MTLAQGDVLDMVLYYLKLQKNIVMKSRVSNFLSTMPMALAVCHAEKSSA
jgi:hypothetical protein